LTKNQIGVLKVLRFNKGFQVRVLLHNHNSTCCMLPAGWKYLVCM